MPKVKGQYDIPFDKEGNLVDYVYRWMNQSDVVWKPNYRFSDELEYVGYSHGRSSCHIHFKSVTDGRKYHMTIGDFHECIEKKIFNDNRIKGEFTFAKRGTCYMMAPLLT